MPKTGARMNGMPVPRMGKFGHMEKSLPNADLIICSVTEARVLLKLIKESGL